MAKLLGHEITTTAEFEQYKSEAQAAVQSIETKIGNVSINAKLPLVFSALALVISVAVLVVTLVH